MENRQLIRAFIVDDDLNAMALLKRLLADYSVAIVGTAHDATPETLNEICEHNPDLLFLDVELPSMLGLDFCLQLREQVSSDMKIVFYTGYDKYLLDALRREAFDYLLKPPSRDELSKIMTHYYENRLSNIQSLVGNTTASQPNIMVVSAEGNHVVLRLMEVAFFRFVSSRRAWEVVTIDNQCYQLRHRTTADVILAYSTSFIQIHKSYIVNIKQVRLINEQQVFLVPPLQDIDELHISKSYRPALMAAFYNL